MASSSKRRWLIRGIVGAVALVGVGAFAIPYVYVHFINKPEPRLTFENRDAKAAKSADPTTDAVTAASVAAGADSPDRPDVSGTWVVGEGSEAGYRVKENLNGQDAEAVGRSSSIDGSVTVTDGKVAAAEFSVDITSMKSDSGRRDGQFTGRIMNADQFPVATFTATSTPEVSLPADGSTTSATVDGVLAMHGVERPVSVAVELRRKDDTVQIQGTIPVVFSDYEIANPSFGTIRTEDSGLIEFLLTMRRA